ncbi:MAG: caspase family protein [Betaproteobacteria bacterium]|nr:caspase family protein [Betaproteobacteria bacterium]
MITASVLRRQLAAAVILASVMATVAAVNPPAEVKVALVIGNAAYPTAPLRNPVNDATAISNRLRALGYEVTLRTDVTQREMTRAVSQFGQSLKPGSVGLFYYAGHGMQVRGRNFLIPVDADIQSEASARSEAVDLDLVLEQLGPTRLSMVILDACRNNPFEGRFRSTAGGGLAQVDAPKGTLLAYATAPGKVASDGNGANGLYTAELLKAMDIPGIKVEEVFKVVRVNVIKATASQQIPWESSSLTGDYYFRPAAAPAPAMDAVKIARDAESKQAEMQSKLDAERKQREKDAQMLKAEMESLRQEVRRLTQSSAPAAAKEPAPAKKQSSVPAKDIASPRKEPTAPAKETAPAGKKLPGTLDASGKAMAAARPEETRVAAAAPSVVRRESAAKEWARRIELLESQRGKLSFSKAVALLFEPLTDEQLLVLVERERGQKDQRYNSALALGINAGGKLARGRTQGESTRDLAVNAAIERCTQAAVARCAVVVVNGDFQEAGFLEWARSASGKSIVALRGDFLRLRSGP